MSDFLAVAAVTATVCHVVRRALGADTVPGAGVTTLRPAALGTTDLEGTTGVNVYCYRVTPNAALAVEALPTRRTDGSLAARPFVALDLHYLLTCHGDDALLEPQRLLGRVAAALAATATLPGGLIRTALAEAAALEDGLPFLERADLADTVRSVTLSPEPLTLEQTSQLWGLLDTPYLLSVAYLATAVVVAADVGPATALPVARRSLDVVTGPRPRLRRVALDPPGMGATVVVEGSGLNGPRPAVRVGPVLLPAGSVTAARITAARGADVPAGLHAVQVLHRGPAGVGGAPQRIVAASDALALAVRPTVTATGDDTALTLTVDPPLHAGQQATLALRRVGAGRPADLTLAVPPVVGEPQAEVPVPRLTVPAGEWLLRLQVDGVESLPTLGPDGYDGPAVTLGPPTPPEPPGPP